MPFAIRFTTFQPPKQVPNPMAMAESRSTHVGTTNAVRMPPETRSAVITPTACIPSFAP